MINQGDIKVKCDVFNSIALVADQHIGSFVPMTKSRPKGVEEQAMVGCKAVTTLARTLITNDRKLESLPLIKIRHHHQ